VRCCSVLRWRCCSLLTCGACSSVRLGAAAWKTCGRWKLAVVACAGCCCIRRRASCKRCRIWAAVVPTKGGRIGGGAKPGSRARSTAALGRVDCTACTASASGRGLLALKIGGAARWVGGSRRGAWLRNEGTPGGGSGKDGKGEGDTTMSCAGCL
jgi:hypothetical protein